MKKAVLLFGAGASIEYKAPSTAAITDAIEAEVEVEADEYMISSGAAAAFREIKAGLADYLDTPSAVNFEHIYHCAHELMWAFEPSKRAMNEYRPLLYPFMQMKISISQLALQALCHRIINIIYRQLSAACEANPLSLIPLTEFIYSIRRSHTLRIYTTNYDDFILQAAPDLYTGFSSAPAAEAKPFDKGGFWEKTNVDSVFHLHGSVHLGFPDLKRSGGDIGGLFWFDKRSDALANSEFHGSDVSRMDGSSVVRTPILTGLDKLSRLQQKPMAYYYAALAQDVMEADILYVIGSGLGDLHLNTWLREARTVQSPAPLLFIDFWQGRFLETTAFENGAKENSLFDDLAVHIKGPCSGTELESGWTVAQDLTSAIWDRGFQAFLAAPADHAEVLSRLIRS